MCILKNAIDRVNKRKRNESARNLTKIATIGAIAGAISALVITIKNDTIQGSIMDSKENIRKKASKAIARSKDNVYEVKYNLKDKKENVEDYFKEGKDIILDTRGEIVSDLKRGKNRLKKSNKNIF